MRALNDELLPVETMLFRSSVAMVATFDCSTRSPYFRDSGPTRNHLFVFPRTTIAIRHEGESPFVSTPAGVTFYNRGQRFTRRAVDPAMGDRCDFFAVAPDVLLDAVKEHKPEAEDKPDAPFDESFAEIPPELFVRERRLIRLLSSEATDNLVVEEAVVALLDALLASRRGPRRPPISGSSRDRVEFAKALLGAHVVQRVEIRDIARATETSLFHLCKLFRQHTGMTMSTYRTSLRLRLGYDAVTSSSDLLSTALGLGFSSHSHFTSAFRSHFGITPTAVRANSAALPRAPRGGPVRSAAPRRS
jgi:AraC-like DNA-binding protein